MIVRRLALFVALLCGLAATQLPEFVQQYRQALGGAVGELEDIVAKFDANSARQGLTRSGGLDRLQANAERMVRQNAADMRHTIGRLQWLEEAQAQFRGEGAVMRLATFATHYDDRIARTAFRDFYPAVPVSVEAFLLGLFGFVFGGSLTHLASRPLRRWRAKHVRTVEKVA